MNKRLYCPNCHYPMKTCICAHVSVLNCDMQISIMQHPSEQKHAKNTARLIPLLLPQTDIFIGEREADFNALKNKTKQHPNSLLVYPCDRALKIGTANDALASKIRHLILLDGTWRKAKKLYLCNPWLHKLDTAVLNIDEPSHYRIRQRPFDNSYSTIEALAYALHALEQSPVTAFIELLNARQQYWPAVE